MDSVIPKKQMSEEDIKRLYITPAIEAKWAKGKIVMEKAITAGKVNIQGNVVVREKAKKADYVLYLNDNNPIAVVEAKDNKHSISAGIQQAIGYAQMLDVPFAYSSNGDGFREHDFLTGKERTLSMDEFPSEAELTARFKDEQNDGKGLSEGQLAMLEQPYYSGQGVYAPRYYQRIAVNRTVNAIAGGQQRVLLVMATGTGKTYTAFQIVHRLISSGMKRKVLYLADRNILVDQSIQQDFAPLEKVTHKIDASHDTASTITAYQMYFSLYQQLTGEKGDEEHYKRLFPNPSFFDLVIVDECHRGSVDAESQWKKILEYFSSATQIGMTATPKETKYLSNIDYFGKPIYTYSLNNGIEDGFLAPFKVINVKTNIGEGWRPTKGQTDINGEPIEDRIYNNSDYDKSIILLDRTREVAQDITNYLKAKGRMNKTIVFCATEEAALRMRDALAELNPDMMQKSHGNYVVRITGNDTEGKGKLKEFISVSAPYPVIATTSELLSTGADCKMVKLIVLDQMIGSMTKFKQIIGRGTRLRWDDNKKFFEVMDFRNVTHLFADPAWDGPIEQVEGYEPHPDDGTIGGGDLVGGDDDDLTDTTDNLPDDQHEPHPKPIVDRDGCTVKVTLRLVSVYDPQGKLLRQESITDYTKRNMLDEYATLDDFIRSWTSAEKKATIRQKFAALGINLDGVKHERGMADVDDFDFLCHVAFGSKPLTRKERAENVRKRDFFSRYQGPAREVLDALLDAYMNSGIYEVENTAIFKIDPFVKYGKISKIISLFGGKEKYETLLRQISDALYAG